MKPNWKIILKKAGIIVLSVMLFALCSVLIYITKTTGQIQHLDYSTEPPAMTGNPNLDVEDKDKTSDYWTVAVFGVDSRNGNVREGTNADTQILCSINRATSDIRIVSLYRDTYLQIDPSNQTYGKLSQAYANKGASGNATALSRNLDITIDDVAAFNWKAAIDTINLLGGVDISLTKAEFAYINSFITETVSVTGVASSHLEAYGMQHLDGVQAVAYMRLRLMDTDYKRTERQRYVIGQIFEKIKVADLGTLYQVVETVLPQIGTSMDKDEILELIGNIKNYKISMTTGFPFTLEVASLGRYGACVIPNTLESNVEQLHEFLYDEEDYTCSEQVREISREIIKDAVKN